MAWDPAFPPRLDIARLNTPVEQMKRLEPSGVSLWVKRDDLTGAGLSGNKIRKLQFAVREALDHGCDTLITCGAVQSNHCRATTLLARRVGMHPVLLLRGQAPLHATGNYLLDRLCGARIDFCTPEVYAQRDRAMQDLADRERQLGHKPAIIAEGCSMPIGCWGYIEAAAEIAQAQRELGIEFDAIVHAVGSGGTSAGLEIGARLFGLRAKIWGVNVCDDERYFRSHISALVDQTIARYKLRMSIPSAEFGLIDGYVGRGYGLSRPEELNLLAEIARTEGLVLDPVYTGKAFYALFQELRAGRFAGAKHILVVHTGGIFGLFSHADEIVPPRA